MGGGDPQSFLLNCPVNLVGQERARLGSEDLPGMRSMPVPQSP